ncbi:MAG: YihY/virulence factor BrkB family protein [Opitutales bacterium]
MSRVAEGWARLRRLYAKEIWQPAYLTDTSWRGRLYAVLRVVSITCTVFGETKTASRAAALSFSSLLGFGPLVAITMVVAGMVLNQKDPNRAVGTLNHIIEFLAPPVAQYDSLSAASPARRHDGAARPNHGDELAHAAVPGGTSQAVGGNGRVARPQLTQMLNGFIAVSRSGTAGTVGALTLIVIVVLLFKSIEDVFNEIWGVRVGRSWFLRIIHYWTILTLGAVLFFASVTVFSAGAFINVILAKLPYGHELLMLLRWLLPLGSGLLLVTLLTLFYRYIPNTHVYWRAALAGAVMVALLLLLNNYLAFIYVRRVVLSKSLYGSLGIVPILMFGLYVFWMYVLIGGQICYAVQNVHYRSSQNAWSTLSAATRERLSLIVLLTIGRRFHARLPPCSALQLSIAMTVPTQILNECLNRLVDLSFITPVPPPGSDPS